MITYTSPKFVEIFKSLISFRPIFYSFDNSADIAMSFDTKYEHQTFCVASLLTDRSFMGQ